MNVGELEQLLKDYPIKEDRVVVSDTYHQTIDFITPGVDDGTDIYTEAEWDEQEDEDLRDRKQTQDVCILVLR